MKGKSSDCTESTESSRQMRGAGEGRHEYLLELPSEAADVLVVGRRRRAHPLLCRGMKQVPGEAMHVSVL